MISTKEKFTQSAIDFIKNHIAKNSKQEVLFAAYLNEAGLIEDIEVLARGDDSEVLAPMPMMDEADVVIHNHPSGVLKPSDADKQIASFLANKGVGSYIINNDATMFYAFVEPLKKRSYQMLDASALASYITPVKNSKTIEKRESQINLLKFIARSFNEKKISIAEGATGVGKSYAYLIPAIMWAYLNNERVVISTATIALQDQLFLKDIPSVLKMLNIKISVVLAKGRQNYLCLLKLADVEKENAGLDFLENDFFNSVKEWSLVTEAGDKNEITFKLENWSDFSSDSDTCPAIHCPHYEKCFVFKARKLATASLVLVANHHLVFADNSLRYKTGSAVSVLPNYKKIIFDEAHNVYASATNYFSDNLTSYMLNRLLGRVYKRKSSRPSGVLVALENILPALHQKNVDKAFKAFDDAHNITGQMQAKMLIFDELNFRLKDNLDSKLKERVIDLMREISTAFLKLASSIRLLLDSLDDEEIDKVVRFEIKSVIDKCNAVSTLASRFVNFKNEPSYVFWAEKTKGSLGKTNVNFIATPLDISTLMQEMVFNPLHTVVMTSATIAVNKSFSFFKKRVGLIDFDETRLSEEVFESPFNYKNQARLFIPKDSPDPSKNSTIADDYVANFIISLCKHGGGKILVLFTSFRSLNYVYEKITDTLGDNAIMVLKQDLENSSKSRLIATFEEHTNAVLLGTDSFWEGVDINNKYLKNVIIAKLPFSVPNNPLSEAKFEELEKQGLNSFLEISEPEMVIKLKQGFGRLIRRKDDFGSIFILDNRILTKAYGKRIISALPKATLKIENTESCVVEAVKFLKEK